MRKKKLSPPRKLQKVLVKFGSRTAGLTASSANHLGRRIKSLDERVGIFKKVRGVGSEVRDRGQKVDKRYGISGRARKVGRVTYQTKEKVGQSIDRVAEEIGVYGAVESASEMAADLIRPLGLDKKLSRVGRVTEKLYGASRGVIKPYFPPDTPEDLLRNTQKELSSISACIMQISPGAADQLASEFGSIVAAKVAGVATSGGLLSLVSTYGAAGTGTAIASLSGAASTNATLAWVGSLLGGGMATGAVLTGGVSIVVGLGAYRALRSDCRDFEELEEMEQRIVQYCWMLMAIIDDHLRVGKNTFSAGQAKALLRDTLLPLREMLVENTDAICGNLDRKHRVIYRQHVLRDFGSAVVDPFEEFVEEQDAHRNLDYEYIIGGVVYALLSGAPLDDIDGAHLVFSALRRSDPDLAGASEAELAEYLSGYDGEQLKGIANNVKGIYHELLWTEQYNNAHSDTRAELIGQINHPGSDVRIFDVHTGEMVDEYQLKATGSVSSVNEHQERYPDIKAVVTDEVAQRVEGVEPSGNLNADLTKATEENLAALSHGNASIVGERVIEASELAACIAAGQELLEMLEGRREFPEATKEAIKKTATAAAATAVAASLFS